MCREQPILVCPHLRLHGHLLLKLCCFQLHLLVVESLLFVLVLQAFHRLILSFYQISHSGVERSLLLILQPKLVYALVVACSFFARGVTDVISSRDEWVFEHVLSGGIELHDLVIVI